MSFNSRLVKGTDVPPQDAELVAALKDALPVTPHDGAPFITGFRNGQGAIYRTVVVAGNEELAALVKTVSRLGYVIDPSRKRDGDDAEADAVFTPRR